MDGILALQIRNIRLLAENQLLTKDECTWLSAVAEKKRLSIEDDAYISKLRAILAGAKVD